MAVSIEHQQMVTTLAKDGASILQTLMPDEVHCWHMATGVSGEAGELLEAIVLPINRDHVIEELGDYEFYFEGLRQGYAIDRVKDILPLVGLHSESNTGNFNYARALAKILSIESSNILDLVKKVVIYNKPIDILKMHRHMAEAEYALAGIRAYFTVTRDQTLDHNIKKLSKGDGKNKPRYEGGVYSDKAAQDRADKEQCQ